MVYQQQQKEQKPVENKRLPKDPLEIVYEIIKKLPLRLQFTDCKPCTIKKYFTRRQLPLFYARAGVLWIHEGLLHDKFTQCRFCKKDLCQNRGENPLRHFLCCSQLKDTRRELFSKGKCDLYTDVNERTTVDENDEPLTTTTSLEKIPWKYKCMQLVFDQKYENLFLNYYAAAASILTKQKEEKEKNNENNNSNSNNNKNKK